MNQTQYFTLTQMIIDDVYFPWGATKLNQLGGGTYTVAGTRVAVLFPNSLKSRIACSEMTDMERRSGVLVSSASPV